MKNKIKKFAAALTVAIVTAAAIFGMTSRSDAKISKSYKLSYEQALDSTDGTGDDDSNGGPQIPPDPNK
ncbi:MAG: hypothetical protein K1X86_14370 [Ignavibacteria bacterium]|nr:hypothetical protein [Ignavibacteria bacterium]